MNTETTDGPYAWLRRFTPDPVQAEDVPWLDRLNADPADAVDSLMRGEASLPGLERASACEALMGLMGDLPDEAPEWRRLDHALCGWLKERRAADAALIERHGGVRHFIREVGEGFRAAWRLELPETSDWVRENLLDLLRWAETVSIDATFDLARAVLAAGAHLQTDRELRFLWLRICESAAAPRLRHRLDIAMLGLARAPVKAVGGPPSHDVVVGLAAWASHLPRDERYKAEVVREWRALKAAFPRQPKFWRGRWDAILDDDRFADHPFLQWLKDSDPALKTPPRTNNQSKREPLLPRNISGTIEEMKREVVRDGLTDPLWRRMTLLLNQLEHYADVTGQSYYLVTSCTSIAGAVRPMAPGSALSLVRRALLWAPSDGHAWSVRAQALETLGRRDLAAAVLWEGKRRVPSNTVISNQLGLLLADGQRPAEAEALLRKAVALDPDHGPTQVEFARVRWAAGDTETAIDGLRGFLARCSDQSAHYTLGSLLVAEGRMAEARRVLDDYRRLIGNDSHAATLARLIAEGKAGQEDMRLHLLSERKREVAGVAVPWDAVTAEAALAAEEAEAPRLTRIGAVSEADLLFGLNGTGRAEALALVNRAMDADESDAYAHLVKALGDKEYRRELKGIAGGRFGGSLPVQLVALPDDAPAADWELLARRFQEGRPLIDLVRLARGVADDGDRARLAAWTTLPNRWDEGWTEFLKKDVAAHLKGEGRLPLATLAHDALTQAVDVGWNATPLVA